MRHVIALTLVLCGALAGLGPLANPVRDAEAVAEALERQLRFDKVLLRRNLDAQGFRAALLELARETAGAELGLVYFAGHGMEVGGKNYLIPVDATLARTSALALEAIPLDAVLEQLDGVTRLKLVILDACRNNPFLGEKRGTRGLARFEPERNSLIAYAAKEGTAADDGAGRHSPYTAALLKHLITPGLEINLLFRRVRTDVLAATGGAQQPAEYHSLGDKEIFLVPKMGSDPAGLTPGQSGLVQPPPRLSEAAEAWAAVKDSTMIAQLEVVVRRFPGTVYADFASARMEALKKQQTALATPPPKAPEPVVSALDPKRKAVPLTAAEERALKPKDSFKECPECPEMVVVPAGSFTMGSADSEAKRDADEGPWHRVTIDRPFAVGKFEVTFAEWDACLSAGGCTHRPSDSGWGRDKRPVMSVSWDDITQPYLPWLSRKMGKAYRLLTEAEWEYVARAGTSTPFWWGSSISRIQANYADKTLPVDSFAPNSWGLYNVHGNVWEWVQDCYHDSYKGAPTDGSAWTAGDCGRRVIRGASWGYSDPWVLRSANRYQYSPGGRDTAVGFRVGRTL